MKSQRLRCNPSNGGKKFSPKKYRRALREAEAEGKKKLEDLRKNVAASVVR